jgi:Chalcone isomerase-like
MSFFALVFAVLSGVAEAGTLAGVTLPDSTTVGGSTVVLNGMGLREKYFIDIYVGALYLPAKTTDATKAITADEPKRIVMHFTYSSVPKDKVNETFDSGFAGVPGHEAYQDRIDTLKGMMTDFTTGDVVTLDYVPGAGTTVTVKGQNKGTIAGADFMKGLWTVYLGPKPPTAALKAGMLGG